MTADTLRAAAGAVRIGLEGFEPEVFIVLGSGLGGLADRVEAVARVPYHEVPGLPLPQVDGHVGEFLAGTIGERRVLCQRGRIHLYEGHAPEFVVLPVRIAAELGCHSLIVTNAAGGVDPAMRPPGLMLITDHINLTGRSGLAGPVVPPEPRFPDMTQAYDAGLAEAARAAARRLGVVLHEGAYVGLLGPSYETPAEIRMLTQLGAQAVGMSTVLEVAVARARAMRVLGFSVISNLGAGMGQASLDHEEVLEAARTVGQDLERLVEAVLPSL